ncbi:hypothetical protein E4U43_005110 [Claviceps pusilla]|uniref:Uncharacterized protein n=1 Tax=Claviceps pusilla TaxID=123648 RepID=A0A9P7T2R5_9HYPO|nr:hypothetical protein E4U43_005110 [Claviceps pusilla]
MSAQVLSSLDKHAPIKRPRTDPRSRYHRSLRPVSASESVILVVEDGKNAVNTLVDPVICVSTLVMYRSVIRFGNFLLLRAANESYESQTLGSRQRPRHPTPMRELNLAIADGGADASSYTGPTRSSSSTYLVLEIIERAHGQLAQFAKPAFNLGMTVYTKSMISAETGGGIRAEISSQTPFDRRFSGFTGFRLVVPKTAVIMK